MKKLVILLAAISVFFTACRTDTTIDTASTAPTATAGDTEASDSTAGDEGDEDDDDGDQDADDQDADSADDTASEPTAEPTATTAPATEEPTATTAPAADSSSADSGATAPSPDQAAALQAVADADDWCEAANAVESGTLVLDTLDFTDPVALEQAITQAVVVINAAERLAPPEIAEDVAVSVEGFTALAAALEDADWSFIDLDLAVIDDLNADMALATYNIEKYNFEVCDIGTDPGEPPTEDELLTPPTDDLEFDGTIRDQAVLGLTQAGFTEAEATCILESLDISDPAAFQDTTALFNVFTDCGISLDRLAQLGGG